MKVFLPVFLALPALVCAVEPGVKGEPLQPRSKPAGTTLFTRLEPAQTGLSAVNRMNVDHPMSYLFHSGMTTGGVAVADFDGDGQPDLFFAGTTDTNRLYRQTGGLKFEDITASAGPISGGENWTAGASAADVNGDGRIDLYVCNYEQPNQLFLNMGAGPKGAPVIFKEVAAAAGVDAVDCSHSAYFADYDGDGRLDMYLLTNRIEDPAGTPKEMPVNKHPDGSVTMKPEAERYYELWRLDYDNWGTEAKGTADRLYRNEGNGPDGTPKFRDVTAASGISGRGDGLGAVWWDYNDDGRLDLYVANDFIAPDRLYRNNGDGTFTNTLNDTIPHTSWFSMGTDFGDVNNDLLPDLLVGDMSATTNYKAKTTTGVLGGMDMKRAIHDATPQYMRNALLINTGTGRFLEAAQLFGVASTDWTWSVKFADFDLDGWQDLYFNNGISRHMNDSDMRLTQEMITGKHMFEFFRTGSMRKEEHRAYRNTGQTRFEDSGKAWGLDHMGVSYGCAYADLDRDGDLDMVEVNLEEPNCIYRNDVQTGHRLLVRLRGTKSNYEGHGATVIVRSAAGAQMRQLQPQSGYHSGNEALVHFGLGKDAVVDELTVRWPGGGLQKLNGLAADQFYTITQPVDGGTPVPPPMAAETLFVKSDVLKEVKVKDVGWAKDFEKQPLLPHGLSQFGPGLAWADVNGDGNDDVYVGGSAGEIGQLRIGDGKGRFVAKWVEPFRTDKAAEDMGALFFDADGDGDLDLFVASGSNEFANDAKDLRDRLYLGDGKGNFAAAPEGAMPDDREFSSAVCAADYDRDGKVDLFVGAWSVPGDWPHAGRSRLLHNESAKGVVKFTDVTASVPGLDKVGMVTGALWSDANGDGWPDLLAATDFGPVKLFQNKQGKLADATAAAGLAAVKGWWRGIAAADFDHDGDLDYVVGNLGLNTRYGTPTAARPHLTFYYDFDGSGRRHIVEAAREGDQLVPERRQPQLAAAMPFLQERFPTAHSFALATLADLYSEEKLANAERYEATEFQTGVFFNERGKFTFKPLERIAQIAPAYGTAVCDFDGDGHADIFLAQNFYGPQTENPRYGGGVGQLLRGDGKGGFAAPTARESGVVVAGDARSASISDLNGDGKPDLVVTVNDANVATFQNSADARWLRVSLPGAGAKATLSRKGEPAQTVETHAGSGFLTQQPATAWFGLGKSSAGGTVRILWPGGGASELPFDGKTTTLKAVPPAAAAKR